MTSLVHTPAEALRRLPWPLPALLAWSAAWGVARALVPWHGGLAFAAAVLAGLALASACRGRWRRLIAAAGFPLSALVLGWADGLPAWYWLLLLLPLLLAYPVRAWRDAPFFPTPAAALQGLDAVVSPAPGTVLDAGCGLGHGLRALHALWPQARLLGLEYSPALAGASALRCRFSGWPAQVRRTDMWAAPWMGHDLVYLFQRPESMARAWAKACQELAPGAWLVSLEFPVPGQVPVASLQGPGRRPLWVYRVPASASNSTKSAGGR